MTENDISLIKPLRSIRTQKILREIKAKEQRVLVLTHEDLVKVNEWLF